MTTSQDRNGQRSKNPQKRESAAILDLNSPNGIDRSLTSYSNGTLRLPRLGADAPNNRHRASVALSKSKVADLIEAVEHAKKIGLPLNKTLSIHFATAALDEATRPQEAISKFLRLASQWLRSRGHAFAYVWVMERNTSIREHVHVMCHCPHALWAEFDKKAEGIWLEKSGMLNNLASRRRSKQTTGRDGRAIEIGRIGSRGYHPESEHAQRTYLNGLAGALSYHLKGLDPEHFPANDQGHCIVTAPDGQKLVIQPEHEGTIFGRRCSRSENISAKARQTYWTMQQADAA